MLPASRRRRSAEAGVGRRLWSLWVCRLCLSLSLLGAGHGVRSPVRLEPSSVERRLALAGVGLVQSPVGPGRHSIAIETARDEESLCCADEVAFTEDVRGGAGCGVEVAQHFEHLCSIQPNEGGRRRSSRRRTRLRAMTRHEEGGGGRARGERFEHDESGWHRGVIDDEEMGRRRWAQADPTSGPMASMCSPSSALTAQRVAGPRPSWISISKSAMPSAGSDRRMVYRRRRGTDAQGDVVTDSGSGSQRGKRSSVLTAPCDRELFPLLAVNGWCTCFTTFSHRFPWRCPVPRHTR